MEKHVTFNDSSDELYESHLANRAVTCIVNTQPADMKDFIPLRILREHRSISYRDNNGIYRYVSVTHSLIEEDNHYWLVCNTDGTIELYVEKEQGLSDFIGKTRISSRVADPMLAFIEQENLTVIFNKPTIKSMRSGIKKRIPMISENGILAQASGIVTSLRFNLSTGKITSVFSNKDAFSPYFVALTAKRPNGEPGLLLFSSDVKDEKKEPLPSTFKELLTSLFSGSSEKTEQKKASIPLGVSICDISKRGTFVRIPLEGAPEWGISSIKFMDSEADDINRLVISEPDTGQEA